ncbi:MAG: hypothetical protein ABI688_08190, partial [Bacteroidota bacterium]
RQLYQFAAHQYSTSTATTGAEIILPVGTESSGEMLSGHFYAGKEKTIVALNSNGIQMNGKNNSLAAEIPTLHVLSSQQAYAITVSFDPCISKRDNKTETIQIESMNISPIIGFKEMESVSDSYSVRAILLVGPSQSPGQYVSGSPYTVTVHFN